MTLYLYKGVGVRPVIVEVQVKYEEEQTKSGLSLPEPIVQRTTSAEFSV